MVVNNQKTNNPGQANMQTNQMQNQANSNPKMNQNTQVQQNTGNQQMQNKSNQGSQVSTGQSRKSNPIKVGGQQTQQAPQEKKSLMWLWITLGIIIVLGIGFVIYWFGFR